LSTSMFLTYGMEIDVNRADSSWDAHHVLLVHPFGFMVVDLTHTF